MHHRRRDRGGRGLAFEDGEARQKRQPRGQARLAALGIEINVGGNYGTEKFLRQSGCERSDVRWGTMSVLAGGS